MMDLPVRNNYTYEMSPDCKRHLQIGWLEEHNL